MKRSLKNMGRVSVFSLLGFLVTGCMAPGVVRIIDKPESGGIVPLNGNKVALIVRDERPETIRKANMIGVNYQTAFHVPVAPVFLGHAEHLDSLVARHVKKRLERAGFEVVSCYPPVQEKLTDEKVSASRFKDQKKDAWEDRKSQKISREDRRIAKRLGKKQGTVQLEHLEEKTVGPWGNMLDVSDADAVVELKIKKFWTDYSYYGSVSWISANLAVCSAHDALRTVFHGSKLKGGGYMFSFFTPLTPSSDATVSVNTAYWFVMNSLEKEFRSPGFFNTVNAGKIR